MGGGVGGGKWTEGDGKEDEEVSGREGREGDEGTSLLVANSLSIQE